VYVDAERIAGPAHDRTALALRRLLDGTLAGRRQGGWWTLFWIYNVAWAAACMILLVPLLPTIAACCCCREQQGAASPVGCAGLPFTPAADRVGASTGMWINRSINEWAAHGYGTVIAGRGGRDPRRLRPSSADLHRHVSSWPWPARRSSPASPSSPRLATPSAAAQRLVQFLFARSASSARCSTSVFSALVSAWYLASYAALATE
jgi:hypothetical protein